SITYSRLRNRLRRTSPNFIQTFQISPFQTQNLHRHLPVAEHRRCARVHGSENALFDGLNINVARGLDARVPQHALRVLKRPVLLHVRSQSAAHHLEGNEPIRDAQLPGYWTDAPPEEVLPPARHRLPFPFPPSECGEHQGLR